MVSSAHPLATRAGVAVLAAGGNAFDATVAVAATLNVVEPENSGVGGYGTILIYDSGRGTAGGSGTPGECRFLNASGRMPRRVDPEACRTPRPGGAECVSTPGNLHAWEELWRAHGSRPWESLFTAAIAAAEEGFPVAPRTAWALQQAYAGFPPEARLIYGDGSRPLAAGDRLIQADLGATLRRIATEGSAPLYEGDLARAIAAEVERRGGLLAAADLGSDRAEWWPAVSIRYRGRELAVPAPPANSFPALVRLGILSRFDVAALDPGSPEYLHLFAEVTKRGTFCRLAYAGDPEVAPPPLDRLLDEVYWRDEAAALDRLRARPFVPPGGVGDPGLAGPAAARHTTHFVVADAEGNTVSATQTIGNLFGSRVLVPGTGIWLNDSLAYCTFDPPGNPMDAHPGRRKLSGDCPLFVLEHGRPVIALGTPGGHTIDQTVAQLVVQLLDFHRDLAAALAAPRISFLEPDLLAVEAAVPEAARRALAERGHRVEVWDRIGNAQALAIERSAGGRPVSFLGAADPRGDGLAQGI
jgi:gamma-glutamyltranspeptidase/glutathione hydrolase